MTKEKLVQHTDKIKVERHGYTLYFPMDIFRYLKRRAENNGRTVSKEIVQVIKELMIQDKNQIGVQ